MRKTKLAAIVAGAALLVLGMAFTAMAGNKWSYQNGEWVAVDSDGEVVEDAWVKGDDGVKYWAGEDGVWLTNAWVDDDTYYVGADGKKAEGWLKLENDDDDVDTWGDYSWYYFSAGKPKKTSGKKGTLIEGKRYAFDLETGRMLYGWVKLAAGDNGFEACDLEDDLTDIANAVAYGGTEDEGWDYTGWHQLEAVSLDDPDDTATYWFYFAADGTKKEAATGKGQQSFTIDGESYTFDETGRMLTGWVPAAASAASASYVIDAGTLQAKEWIWTVPTKTMNETDYTEETEHWFYAASKGVLERGRITYVKSNKKVFYGFDKDGIMLSGLYVLPVSAFKGDNDEITISYNYATKSTAPALAQQIDDVDKVQTSTILKDQPTEVAYFFFGDEETDGSMKTGSQTITIDGEDVTLRFAKNSTSDKFYRPSSLTATTATATLATYTQGACVTGFQGGCYYVNGVKLAAAEDTGYQLFQAVVDSDKKVLIQSITPVKVETVTASASFDEDETETDYEVYDAVDGQTQYVAIDENGKILSSGTHKDADGNKLKSAGYVVTKITLAD